jgi:hypothetical protein
MALSISKAVTEFLKTNPEKKFTAHEIAKWITQTHPLDCELKLAKSKNKNLLAADTDEAKLRVLINILVAEIGSQRASFQKKTPQIKTTGENPRHFYFTEKSDDAEVEDAESKESILAGEFTEHDLYPLLSDYLWDEFRIYSKRIDEKKSSNTRGHKGNEWLYPDLVALEDLASEWDDKIAECASKYGDKKAKLWSFEVKKLINTSNVRSAFFQAVSNSSWANFGYLVAAEIEEKAKRELTMLSSLHGIGFIRLDPETPSESTVMIPAREKPNLDWDSINRLAEANKDFMLYIQDIKDFCLTGRTRKADWF